MYLVPLTRAHEGTTQLQWQGLPRGIARFPGITIALPCGEGTGASIQGGRKML